MKKTNASLSLKHANKGLVSLLMLSMVTLVSSAVNAQEYKKIKRLGTSESVCAGGVQTAAELQTYFAENPNVIRTILNDSGWSGSADALLEAVASGQMTEKAYPVGTKLAWMGSKKFGKYVALPYREWAGSKSFEGFEVMVSSGCKVYEVAIPKACCNVSLISVSEDTSEACAPVADQANNEAVVPAVVDSPSTVDATNKKSSNVDPMALVPFFGAWVGTETRPRFETAWAMDMRDSSGVTGVKAGLMKPLSEKTSVTGTLSYYDRNGVNEGNVYPDDNLAIDLGMEYKLSDTAFIGAGLGSWNVDDSDFRDTSMYGMFGGAIGESNMQWFVEGRIFESDSPGHNTYHDNKMVSAGFRYLIK